MTTDLLKEEIPADFLRQNYHFELPEEQIAKRPLQARTDSKLLVLKKNTQNILHQNFKDITEQFQSGDCLVVNNTRVVPARLYARRVCTNGRIEVLLSRPAEKEHEYICLLAPGRRLRPGIILQFIESKESDRNTVYQAEILEKQKDEPGAWRLAFYRKVVDNSVTCHPYELAEAHGEIPLPPYMNRKADAKDDISYQTVYSKEEKKGAAAAPTAGLHFSPELLKKLEEKGVNLCEVTLTVGPGTFLPVREDDIREHPMHAEPWDLSAKSAEILNMTLKNGGRIIPVGTTSLRVLESAAQIDNNQKVFFNEGQGVTRIFIYPGYIFKACDALITNFHLPESSLLMLVSALCGREKMLAAYNEAIAKGYRFFSYGDASFLERLTS